MKKFFKVVIPIIVFIFLAIAAFGNQIAEFFSMAGQNVMYYGCPNSRRIDKLILKKTGEKDHE